MSGWGAPSWHCVIVCFTVEADPGDAAADAFAALPVTEGPGTTAWAYAAYQPAPPSPAKVAFAAARPATRLIGNLA